MKGKGVIVILFFLVVFPFIVDLILAIAINEKDIPGFAMTGFLLPMYIKALPFYICYLIGVYIKNYFIKKWQESQTEINE